MLDGVDVEVPLDALGTVVVIRNDDKPGVIGEVGTILGRHGINIGAFALGRAQRWGGRRDQPRSAAGRRHAERRRHRRTAIGEPAIREVKLVTLGTGAA